MGVLCMSSWPPWAMHMIDGINSIMFYARRQVQLQQHDSSICCIMFYAPHATALLRQLIILITTLAETDVATA
jgi:hypothetical protein